LASRVPGVVIRNRRYVFLMLRHPGVGRDEGWATDVRGNRRFVLWDAGREEVSEDGRNDLEEHANAKGEDTEGQVNKLPDCVSLSWRVALRVEYPDLSAVNAALGVL
jgi:hypothetical protein